MIQLVHSATLVPLLGRVLSKSDSTSTALPPSLMLLARVSAALLLQQLVSEKQDGSRLCWMRPLAAPVMVGLIDEDRSVRSECLDLIKTAVKLSKANGKKGLDVFNPEQLLDVGFPMGGFVCDSVQVRLQGIF